MAHFLNNEIGHVLSFFGEEHAPILVHRDIPSDQIEKVKSCHISVLTIQRANDFIGDSEQFMKNNIMKIRDPIDESVFFAINSSKFIADGTKKHKFAMTSHRINIFRSAVLPGNKNKHNKNVANFYLNGMYIVEYRMIDDKNVYVCCCKAFVHSAFCCSHVLAAMRCDKVLILLLLFYYYLLLLAL